VSPEPRRSRIGGVSLGLAVAGTAACHAASAVGPFAGATWLRLVGAGFEAAVVGGLADWFAVTALFRHPLGLPIPHTAIIPTRRAKITEGIVAMIEQDWLSPDVIGARLDKIAPSALVVDWLRDPAHVERIGAPVRDLLAGLARVLTEPEVAEFADRAIHGAIAELPLDATAGRWLAGALSSDAAGPAFDAFATSLANLAERDRTAAELHWWLDRSARTLAQAGKRLVPFVLRRKVVQRKLIEAACGYASTELRAAAGDPDHPLKRTILGALRRFADRLAAGDADALRQADRIRTALLESLEAGPIVRRTLERLRAELETELASPTSALSTLIDRRLRSGVLEVLDDPERRATFDRWVRATARDLLARHHHQIGITVRENLDALETETLVARIEDRVGADLQYIRLNGAVVGGLVGLALAVGRWFFG
jgi:uncharacterized membrane-anchored protein YjiN (DUF445 family)